MNPVTVILCAISRFINASIRGAQSQPSAPALASKISHPSTLPAVVGPVRPLSGVAAGSILVI